MAPACLMVWVSWIPILSWLQGVSKLKSWWKTLTATLITIAKDIKVAQVAAANVVPKVVVVPGTLEKLDEIQGIQWTKISVELRKEMLFQQLELSGLEGWPIKTKQLQTVH